MTAPPDRPNAARAPILLTPGPVTLRPEVKAALVGDHNPMLGSTIEWTAQIRRYALSVANATATHVCVPIQGTGSYAIEAVFRATVPPQGKLLILVNGFYGQRLVEIARGLGLAPVVAEFPLVPLPTGPDADLWLSRHPDVTHLAVCHCETGTGVLNPIDEIARATRARGVRLIVDAIASLGASPLDVAALAAEAIVFSSNKCFESAPGLAFVVIARDSLEQSSGRSPGPALDLHAQWLHFEKTGQWRYTPPTNLIAALACAMEFHEREGGVRARGEKYRRNWRRLVDGLRQRGFATLIPDEVASPVVATFLQPDDPNYAFEAFYTALARRGFMIFPGRLTAAGTFRIGCMGNVDEATMSELLQAMDEAFAELGVASRLT